MTLKARLGTLGGIVAATLLLVATSANATICTIPAPGDLPPNCTEGYVSPDEAHMIIDGLPAGTEIIVDASHNEFFNIGRAPGGNLGGEVETFDSFIQMQMTGTGALAGFNRFIGLSNVAVETHTGPRNPSDPVQDFDTEMVHLFGQLFGDPDFTQFSITAGSANGLPSPGHTTLTELPGGNFNVDSFFDVEYRIDFQGAPGSALEGFAGSTTATIRMQAGETIPVPEPSTFLLMGLGAIGWLGLARKR